MKISRLVQANYCFFSIDELLRSWEGKVVQCHSSKRGETQTEKYAAIPNLPGEETPPEEEKYADLQQQHRSQETRNFYRKLKASDLVSLAEMWRDKSGSILTDDCQVTEKWKEHVDEHLNGTQAEDNSGGESNFVCATIEEEVPSPTIGEVNDAIK